MTEQTDILGMLDLITAPGLCVKQGLIVRVNSAGASVGFEAGMGLAGLLTCTNGEYDSFRGGCLCLTLHHMGRDWSASVTRHGDMDIIVLEAPTPPELQALALAARELRLPLSNAMLLTDKLLQQKTPELADPLARLNKGLHQLLRIVGNMSDAPNPGSGQSHSLQDIGALTDELAQKLEPLVQAAGLVFHYQGLEEQIYTLCDPRLLERAILNLVSNAIKFTPKDGFVRLSLSRSSRMLCIGVEDSGSGIAGELLEHTFCRYQRQPALEDSRFGIGLGMAMVRSAAASHGGTVLIDQPEGSGTRVTMTLAIRQEQSCFQEQILRPVPSGYDTGLIELSEVLPASLYDGCY